MIGWPSLRDPRTGVLGVLALIALVGLGRKVLQSVRSRRALNRLGEADVTPEEIEDSARHGRDGVMELFRILGTDGSADRRAAAGRALSRLWKADELIAEEEKAIVTRGYVVTWKARRRYPRAMTRPVPIAVEFGVPFLEQDGPGVSPRDLEWSYRIGGSERASLESFSDWRPGPCRVAFAIDPGDFPGAGPHRLSFQARARTVGLTTAWEQNLPHIPFTFEFDPVLSVDALLTLPDEARAERIAGAVRLDRSRIENEQGSGSEFLPLDEMFALREPPDLVVTTPLPCDLAHAITIEFEGIAGSLPAGEFVLAGQGIDAPPSSASCPLGPVKALEPGRIDRPGERRMRVVLTPDPERAWADPDIRSLWPGTITTDWYPARIVRR